MEGPAFILPIWDRSSEGLVGVALVSKDDLDVPESLVAEAERNAAGRRFYEISLRGPEMSAVARLDGLPEDVRDGFRSMFDRAISCEVASSIFVPDAAVVRVEDHGRPGYVPGVIDCGRVRAVDFHAWDGGFYWTAIASHGDSEEDVRVQTGSLTMENLEYWRSRLGRA